MNSNEQMTVGGNKSLILTTNVSRPINVNIHYKNKYDYETHTTGREKVPNFILTTISHFTL